MQRKEWKYILLSLAAVLCLLAPTAIADSVLTFTSNGGATAGGVYISPYYGTVNGGGVIAMICDSYTETIAPPSTWLASASLASAPSGRYGSGYYSAAAYLGDQILSTNDNNLRAIYSFALWDLLEPSAFTISGNNLTGAHGTFGDYASVLAAQTAALAATPGDLSQWTIYTPTLSQAGYNSYSGNQIQEFLVKTPDGGTTLMLLGGALAGLATLRRRFRA